METNTRRNTRQRELILSTMQGLSTHPSAIEVYELVHKKDPNMSISTVYRNLDILSKEEKILKIFMPGENFARFDFRIDKHQHIKCKKCSKLFDIDFLKIDLNNIKSLGFKDISYNLDFYGLCKDCQAEDINNE